MGKIRYKEPSENFKKNLSNQTENYARSSIGHENYVGEYYQFSIDILIPYEKQARQIFNEKEIEELAATIKENGIQNPLLVVKSKKEDDKFEVVSGERRLRAAKFLGLKKVPCIVVNEEKAEEIALIENIQRTDLHPIEVANAMRSILENPKWGDMGKFSSKIGKDPSVISQYLSFARLPESVKNELIQRNIRSRDTLRKILRCDDEKEMLSFLKKDDKKDLVKSILRIRLEEGELKVQDRQISGLDKDVLLDLKEKLRQLIIKIEDYAVL